MKNRKGLLFSLDAMLALTLVAIAATVFVFSFNVDEMHRHELMQIKDEVRDGEAVGFMTGQSAADLGLREYTPGWESGYSFAACEKGFEYDDAGLGAMGSVNAKYYCKGVS